MTKMLRIGWRRGAIVGGLLLMALLAWLFWTHNADSTPSSQWLPIAPQLIENRLGLTGHIQAADPVTLSTPFDATVRDVLVSEGQAVTQGQPLLTLDTRQLDIKLRQAQAELLKAQRNQQELQHWAQSQEVARARRTLNNARLNLANTEANLKDTQTLFTRGIVARMEVDTLTQQAQAQRLDVEAAQAELQVTLDKGRGEERQIAEMDLANAQSLHQYLLTMQAQQVVRAPFAGVLVRPVTPETEKRPPPQSGMLLTQGSALFGLINPDRLQVIASIEETDLYLLREGMPVEISGDGFTGLTLQGQIQYIGLEGRAATTEGAGARYDVRVAIAPLPREQRQRLRLGMSARLSVVSYRNPQGIAVPAQALHTDESGNTYIIFRPDSNSPPQQLIVTPGPAVPQGVEIHGARVGEVQIDVQP